MGFKPSTSSSALFAVRFSSFLGALFLATPDAVAAIKKVKDELGEAAVKSGFQGIGENTSSGKARKTLLAEGVEFGDMAGRLTGVRLLERDIKGRKMPYLSVTLTDESGKYNLSVSLGERGAQMLARKLVNASPEAMTDLALFCTYEQKPGRDRAYAEQGCSLKQDGKQVPGIDPKIDLVPQIDAAMAALTDAGIAIEDKDVRGKRRASLTTDFHVNLVKQAQAAFDAYYKARDMEAESPTPADAPSAFADMDDEIPF